MIEQKQYGNKSAMWNETKTKTMSTGFNASKYFQFKLNENIVVFFLGSMGLFTWHFWSDIDCFSKVYTVVSIMYGRPEYFLHK